MTRVLASAVAILVIGSLALGGCAPEAVPTAPTTPTATIVPTAAEQEPIDWKLHIGFPLGTLQYGYLCEMLAARASEATEGMFKIETFPAGTVVSSPELANAARTGVMDMVCTYGAYHPGVNKIFDVVNSQLWPTKQSSDVFRLRGGEELNREIWAKHLDVYMVGDVAHPTPLLEGVFSKKPVYGPEDLKGLRIRAYSIPAKVYAEYGAVITQIPAEEFVSGLERGIIDAGDAGGLKEAYQEGLHEIVDYVFMGAEGTTKIYYGYYLANEEAWAQLPDGYKAILKMAVNEIDKKMSVSMIQEDLEGIKLFQDAGVEVIRWSAEDCAAWSDREWALTDAVVTEPGSVEEEYMQLIRETRQLLFG